VGQSEHAELEGVIRPRVLAVSTDLHHAGSLSRRASSGSIPGHTKPPGRRSSARSASLLSRWPITSAGGRGPRPPAPRAKARISSAIWGIGFPPKVTPCWPGCRPSAASMAWSNTRRPRSRPVAGLPSMSHRISRAGFAVMVGREPTVGGVLDRLPLAHLPTPLERWIGSAPRSTWSPARSGSSGRLHRVGRRRQQGPQARVPLRRGAGAGLRHAGHGRRPPEQFRRARPRRTDRPAAPNRLGLGRRLGLSLRRIAPSAQPAGNDRAATTCRARSIAAAVRRSIERSDEGDIRADQSRLIRARRRPGGRIARSCRLLSGGRRP